MRTLFEYAATHPRLPLILASALYLWITLASLMVKKPGLAGMWFCYAMANFFMLSQYD